MFTVLMWITFGFIVGLLAKALHPGEEPSGCLPTVVIGVAGSFVGGGINWAIGRGEPLASSGFLMSIIGGIICCMIWRWWTLKNSPEGPKSFFTGRRLK